MLATNPRRHEHELDDLPGLLQLDHSVDDLGVLQ
jgi:hypothetical protein